MNNKRIMALILTAAMTIPLAACANADGGSASEAASEVATEAAAEASSEAATEAATEAAEESATTEAATGESTASKVINPLENWLTKTDLETLDDCIVAVSFSLDDLYTIESGDLALDFTVWDYDIYDMVDISQMAVGDAIVIQGETVDITSLERDDDGAVIINGGIENGGYELRHDDDTVFYPVTWDDLRLYHEVGKTSQTISEKVVFTDSSDLEAGEVTYGYSDLENPTMEDHFVPNNTTIRMEGGAIVGIARVYNP